MNYSNKKESYEFKKLILLLVITVTSLAGHAADRYWVTNVAGFSNWSDAANWSATSGGAGGASVPGVTDMAIFDGNGSGACHVDINANIYGLHLRNGYNGNVDMQAGITLIVSAGNATFNDSTFNGADGDITVNGNFTINGGSFNSTTGVLTIKKDFAFTSGGFDEKTGTVRFNGSSQTFNSSLGFHNLEIAGSGNKNINPSSTFFVYNSFTLSSVSTISINGGSINVYKDMLINNLSPYGGGTGLIRITGANNQTITSTSGLGLGELPNVEINKSGGAAIFNGTVSVNRNWTYLAGDLDYTTNDATIALTGSNQTIIGGETFNNFYIGGSNTKMITAAITVSNLFTISSNNTIYINGDPINVMGDMHISNTSPYNSGSSLIRITGGNNQTITSTSMLGRGEVPNVEIDKSGGTATFNGIISTTGNWTYIGGDIDYTTNDATVALTGGSQAVTGIETFNNLYLGGANTKKFNDEITVSGLFTFSSNGTIHINGNPINVTGNMLISNTSPYNAGSGLIRITGANNQTVTGMSALAAGELPNVEIDKSGGTATFKGIVSTNKDWTYIGGNIDYNSNDATVALTGENQTLTGGETFDNLFITGSGTKNIISTSNVVGLFTFGSVSPININGSPINVIGDILVSNTHYDNAGTGLIRISGSNNQLIESTAVVTRGELPNVEIDKSGGTATFKGIVSTNKDWTYIGGNIDYTSNAATVALTGGDQTLTGNNNFHNFHITGSDTKNIISTSNVVGLFTFGSVSPININGSPINVMGNVFSK